MRYTVFESGRPIGETDLEFTRIEPRARFGYFHPNELGESLMPVIRAVLPALTALHLLEEAACAGSEAPTTEVRQSTEFADWAEAMHRLEQLDLELRRADGTVIPTEHISLQDTEAVHSVAFDEDELADMPWDDEIDVGIFDGTSDDDESDGDESGEDAALTAELDAEEAELEAALQSELKRLGEWMDAHGIENTRFVDGECEEESRYQICVVLRHDTDIP